MSEENNEEITVREEPNRKPLYLATAVVGLLIVGAFAFWFLSNREAGKIVQPPRTVTFGDNSGEQPTGEQTITIEPDQVEKIGLKIETVGETLSSEAMTVAATGVIQPNAYKETPVISLLGGILRGVSGELGQNVARGQTLAILFSDELAASQSRYLALQTEAQTARQNYERTAKLVKISPVSSTEVDQMLARLKIAEAELEEHHRHHARTIKLLEIGAVSREEFEMATTKLKTAEANLEEAKKRHDRAVQVAQINPVSRSEFEQAAVKRQTAESDLATAKQRLLLLGLSPQKVNTLRSPSHITATLALTAPVSGTITKRMVNQGEVVEANKELMCITNLSSVWAIAQVYEKDIANLRVGSGASVTTDSYPNELFRGHVTYIDPNIDQATRTAQVRVELDNPGQILKIGMYVNVAFGSMGVAERTMPVIPSSAVQNMNDRQVVFVTTGKPNVFTIKTVRLGKENNGQFTVIEGLNVGDHVVTEGSFLLRAEVIKQNPSQ
ncbi:MAG: efflux RND transporter periplasmic adaptor subunit [Pyrinomonadaceae bacterium]